MLSINEIKVGIVGVGPHFKEILFPALMSQDGVTLTAFCDVNKEARKWVEARFPQAVVTSDISEQRFWDSIDCVICCSWPKVHQGALLLAAKFGKHCFCEKPVALNSAGLDQIIKNHKIENLVMRIGHVFRYAGGSARFIDILSEERLVCLEISYIGSGPRGKRWDLGSRRAFSLIHLTHAIDFVIAVAGNVITVKNAIWSRVHGSESLTAIFRTERCPMVCLFGTNAATAFTCKATAVLESGAVIVLDTLRNVTVTGLTASAKRSGSVWRERDLGTVIMNDGYVDELRDFFAEIRGAGHCRLPGLAQARHVLSVIEKLL